MQKKLTISLDEHVYEGLQSVVGQENISRFIEDLVRPHVIATDKSKYEARMGDALYDDEDWDVTKRNLTEAELEAGYRAMAADEEHEAEALEWIEGTLLDMNDESR